MRLISIVPETYGIKKDIRINAVAVGSKGPNQNMFLIPVRSGDHEPDDELWDIVPTSSNKPQIFANTAPGPGGVILRITTLNRPGRRIGKIYVRESDLPHFECVGFGVAGDEDGIVTWEEVVLRVDGPCLILYLVNVGPPNEFVEYDGEEVSRYPALEDNIELLDDDFIRIDDPRVRRWKPPEDHAN